MIVRLDAPLYFLNAGVAQTMIREIAATQPQPRALLIDLGASGDLDVPTMDLIADVDVKLRTPGRDAHVRPDARRRARPAGAGAVSST